MPCRSVLGGGIPACLAGQSRGGVSLGWGGGLQFFGGRLSNYLGGGDRHRNTVNVRPVRILLECILVNQMISWSSSIK